MTPVMTLLLSLFYLLVMAVSAVVLVACGGCISPRFPENTACQEQPRWCCLAWIVILHYVLGLALVSLLTTWFGLFGAIRPIYVFPVLFLLSIMGGRRALRFICAALNSRWNRDNGGEKDYTRRWFIGFAITWGIVMSVNVTVGGMLPPLFQDDLWYHVTLPGQWILTGSMDSFPYVFPSNYALAMESVYTVLLLAGDEVLCPMLYAQVTVILLWTIVLAVVRLAGQRRLLPALVLPFIFIGTGMCIAPLSAGNDAAAALVLLTAFVLLMEYIRDHPPGTGSGFFLVIGFIFGTAIAIKLTALAFTVPVLLISVLSCLNRRMPARATMKMILLIISGILVAYMPWAIRGWQGSGNPVFPLARNLFPVHEAYLASFGDSANMNSLFPFTAEGLREAVAGDTGFRLKLWIALTGRDFMFSFLLMGLACSWLLKQRFWRIQAVILLVCFMLFLFMRGHNETVRYLSICYPLSAPLLSELLGRLLDLLKTKSRSMLLAALFAGGLYGGISKQFQVAGYRTVQWKFMPVLTCDQRVDFAKHAQYGPFYLDFQQFEAEMELGTRVLLADTPYPYYLKRRAVWSDTRQLMDRIWSHMISSDIAIDLAEQGIEYMVIREKNIDVRIDELIDRGVLVRKSTGRDPNYRFHLFSVHPPDLPPET
jgi:hypothetical protein